MIKLKLNTMRNLEKLTDEELLILSEKDNSKDVLDELKKRLQLKIDECLDLNKKI